jgi:hypothetical protein
MMLTPIVITSIMGKLWETFFGAFFGFFSHTGFAKRFEA